MRRAATTALCALAALALISAVATARSGITVGTASTTLTLPRLSLEGGLGEPFVCSVTLATTLHSSVAKTAAALLGTANVTLSTGGCSTGNIGLLVRGSRVTGARGPYHITYQSFTGTLPNISSLTWRLNDIEFWIDALGIVCLTDGPVDIDLVSIGGNPMTGASVNAQTVPLTGGFLCLWASIGLNGAGSFSSSVRLTLF